MNEPSGIQQLVNDHFVQLFLTEGDRQWGDILDCLDLIVTTKMNDMLRRPVNNNEIEDGVRQMGGLKLAGPNGFQGVFYQNFWEIISPKIKGLVVECLNDGVCPKQINATYIALILKVPNLESVN